MMKKFSNNRKFRKNFGSKIFFWIFFAMMTRQEILQQFRFFEKFSPTMARLNFIEK